MATLSSNNHASVQRITIRVVGQFEIRPIACSYFDSRSAEATKLALPIKNEEIVGSSPTLCALMTDKARSLSEPNIVPLPVVSNKGRRGVASREVLTTPLGLISLAIEAKR
jgi:hypothetical protein